MGRRTTVAGRSAWKDPLDRNCVLPQVREETVMGVRLEDLPPKAREQVARKMVQNTSSGASRHLPFKGKAEWKTVENSAWPSAEEAKYHNVKTTRQVGDNVIHFDSQKEARRFDELVLLERAGKIRELKLQVDFTLQEAYTNAETGNRVRAIRYKADFTYLERVRDDFGVEATEAVPVTTPRSPAVPAPLTQGSLLQPLRRSAFSDERECGNNCTWRLVVEDVKTAGTKTRVYEIKKKLMLEKFGIAIREV